MTSTLAARASTTTHRDFLAIPDFSRDELLALFDLAERMRDGKYTDTPLAGKTLAMIFMKSSTRTRVSFEVGTYQLGGHALFLSPRDVQLGRGEPIADTARVLSRYVDGIMIRTFDHGEAEELARCATVPVINGLTKLSHPCQVMADIMTFEEKKGPIRGNTVAWVGDANNVCASWVHAASRFDFTLKVASPESLAPRPALRKWAETARAKQNEAVRARAESAASTHATTADVASEGRGFSGSRRASR